MTEGSFEAKLTAKRETAAGIYLTIQVQPDDYRAELATLRVGSVLMLGWAEIVDSTVEEIPAIPSKLSPETVEAKMPKDRRPFETLPLSQQAAMLCADARFREFLGTDRVGAAEYVRSYCGVQSRGDIKEGQNSGKDWLLLRAKYDQWLTDQKYAGVAR